MVSITPFLLLRIYEIIDKENIFFARFQSTSFFFFALPRMLLHDTLEITTVQRLYYSATIFYHHHTKLAVHFISQLLVLCQSPTTFPLRVTTHRPPISATSTSCFPILHQIRYVAVLFFLLSNDRHLTIHFYHFPPLSLSDIQ